MIFSTGITSTIGFWALQGNVHGNGPKEPHARKAWEDAGNKPYTVRIPGTDTWADISRWDPIATPLKVIANLVEDYNLYEARNPNHEYDATHITNMLGIATLDIAATITDMNMLQGMKRWADLFNTATSEEEVGVKGSEATALLMQMGQGFIPNAVRKVADYKEPVKADPQTAEDMLKATLPGMRGNVNLAYTILGTPRKVDTAILPILGWPLVKQGQVEDDKEAYVYQKVATIMAVTGNDITLPKSRTTDYSGLDLRTVKTHDGSMSMYDLWNKNLAEMTIGGVTLKEALYNEFKAQDSYNMANPGNDKYISDQTKAVTGILRTYREAAWQLGVQQEANVNPAMIERKTLIDQLKEDANNPNKRYDLQSIFGRQ
jgi:hypothetical protein